MLHMIKKEVVTATIILIKKNDETFELQKNPIYNEENNDLLGITLDPIYS